MIQRPVQGIDYPGSLPEVRRWFASDADCFDYLDWLRWPDGFVCPRCAGVADWVGVDGLHRCGDCGRRVSTLAGTVFHRTRTPLTVWFEAVWLLMASKQGLSALELQRVTGLGSYQTAWTMLHKLRTAMASEGRDRLTGRVEVDEMLYGGLTPGRRGRATGAKTIITAAVERRGRGYGRIRMQVVPTASRPDLAAFLRSTVAPGSTVVTDGLRSYPGAAADAELTHEPHSVLGSGRPAHEILPGVHLVFSLARRVLDGTHQGGIQEGHMQAYLNEFVFRFNRRHATERGLLFLRLLEHAVTTAPTTYDQLAIQHRRMLRPAPKPAVRPLPPSLAGKRLRRPWRKKQAA